MAKRWRFLRRGTSREDHDEVHGRNTTDIEEQKSPNGGSDGMFTYNPTSFLQRLAIGFHVKNKLETSKLVRVRFNVGYKYSLIIILLLAGAFLTPQLLPRWLGFEWASARDLCQFGDQKLKGLEQRLANLTNLSEAKLFLQKQQFDLACMNRSAESFYHGSTGSPSRYQWPDECTSEQAQISLAETTCVSQTVNVCKAAGGFAGFFINIFGNCEKKNGPDVCVESTHPDRANALLQLEQQRSSLNQTLNDTTIEEQPIVATANVKIQELMARLLTQVDIAADAFILYSVISIAVGMPLIIYKREKGSRIIGATLGLTKVSFIIVFVVALSLYDSVILVVRETDFARLFQNFLNDPCYVDPEFSNRRVSLIVGICNNLSVIDTESDHVLQKMDAVYYDTRLFGFCKDDSRDPAVHPKLTEMDTLRGLYRQGNISNPGVCNATRLNEQTSTAPNDPNVSKLKALLGSGVVAQLLLKFVVTSWFLHLFAFLEPMILHNGKVEIWGADDDVTLNQEEQRAAKRFARDRHLLPLLLFSLLMLIEVILIIYSLVTTLGGEGRLLEENIPEVSMEPDTNMTCSLSLLSF